MAHKVQLLLHLEQSNYFIGLLAVVAVESLQVSNRTPNNTDAILHDVKVSMPMTTYGHDFVPAAISRQNLSDTARSLISIERIRQGRPLDTAFKRARVNNRDDSVD
jgi:hypothetical protein